MLGRPLSAWTSAGHNPDAALLSRAKAGDRKAFDALVKGYQIALRGFVVLRVGPEAADDILQDTWTACWLGLPQYSGRSRFKAWLYAIAANKCADYHRGRERSATQSLDTLEEVAG